MTGQANSLEMTPKGRLDTLLSSFRLAAWLGWQIESNWTDPFLFAIYSIIRPLSSAGILVVMYAVITHGNFNTPIFPYMYLGNAFYIYVGAIMTGVSWAVIDDREHYRTLKYIFLAPISYPSYLMGRSVARFLIASVSVLITVLFGVLFLHVPVTLAQIQWPLFLVSLLIGVVMLAFMGLIIAGVSLLIAHHYDLIGEAVAAALYLFSGAIFPLEVLPPILRPIGYLMPITYWLELIRRSLVGQVAAAFPTLQNLSDMQIMGILLGLTVFFGVVSMIVFRRCEHLAAERGMIDMVTNY
jgi:ABC-2 type transport system permease protein